MSRQHLHKSIEGKPIYAGDVFVHNNSVWVMLDYMDGKLQAVYLSENYICLDTGTPKRWSKDTYMGNIAEGLENLREKLTSE